MDVTKNNAQYVNAEGVLALFGRSSKQPSALLWHWVRRYGFPRPVKIGGRSEWKVEQVVAWRENQHAMSK